MFCGGFRQHISPDVLGKIFATNHTELLLCFYFLQGSGAHTNLSIYAPSSQNRYPPPPRGFSQISGPKDVNFFLPPAPCLTAQIYFPKNLSVGDVSKIRDTLKPLAFNEPYQFWLNLGWSLNLRHTMTHPYFDAVHCRVCFNIRPPVRQAGMFFWGLGMNRDH